MNTDKPKEGKINDLNIMVWVNCPHCGVKNDPDFELGEYDKSDSFCIRCWECDEAYHITLPVQKPMK